MPSSKIETREYGLGRPSVVVLHGGPGAPGSAEGLARGLSKSFHVIEPIQRRSGGPILTVNQHINDLADVCPAQSVIVGWSWGAMLALSFAALHPERVLALVLVGCGTYDSSSRNLIKLAVLSRLSAKDRERYKFLADALNATLSEDKQEESLAELGALVEKASSYAPCLNDVPSTGSLRLDVIGHRETWTDVLRLQAERIEPRRFQSIRVPVLMVHGDTDAHPGKQTARVLRQHIPQLEYEEITRCGHTPWHELHARRTFFDLVRQWIIKSSSGQPSE